MKKAIFFTVLMGSLAFTSVQAQQIPARQHEGVNKTTVRNPQKGAMQDLGLSADQQAKLKALREESRVQMKAIQNDKNLTQQEKNTKIEALRTAQQSKREAILTPEQKAQLNSRTKEMQSNRGKGRDATNVEGQPMGQRMGRGTARGSRGQNNWKALNLTDPQKAEMQVLREEGQSQLKAIREDKNLSPQEKKAKIEELQATQTVKRNAILTPEQQRLWESNAQQGRGRGYRQAPDNKMQRPAPKNP